MITAIEWLTDGVELPRLDYQRLEHWLVQVAAAHNRIVRTVNYIFCNDNRILEVNRQFLQHDYYTDIITFDTCTGRLLRGDIYISLDTVADNAAALSTPPERELLRVIIHGILHLCGINDKGPGEREVMEQHENEALQIWDSMDTTGQSH